MGSLNVGTLFMDMGINMAPFQAQLKRAEGQARASGQRMTGEAGGGGMGGAAAALLGGLNPYALAAKAAAVLGGAMAAGGAIAVKTAADYEQVEVAMTNMMHSSAKAKAFLGQLWDFAAKTPFEFPQVTAASQKLLAFGFEAKGVIPLLTNIGDAAAASGKGPEAIDRIVTSLGQMKAKGRVQGDELLQLMEANIPAAKYLAAALGTDIPGALKKVESGAVGADIAIKAISEGMKKDFGGMMDAQSKTFLGRLSTMHDAISKIFRDVGQALLPYVGGAMDKVSKLLAQWPALWRNIKPAVIGVADAFKNAVMAIMPLFSGLNVGNVSAAIQTGLHMYQSYLEGVKNVVQQVVNVLMHIGRWITSLFSLFYRFSGIGFFAKMFLQANDAAMFARDAARKLADERAEAAEKLKGQQEMEAAGVLEVMKATNAAAEAEKKRRMAAVGWGSLQDVWKNAMVAGVKSSISQGAGAAAITSKTLPSDAVLKSILKTNQDQLKEQQELLKAVKVGVGYGA
jgi:tape measure domain-containing protein